MKILALMMFLASTTVLAESPGLKCLNALKSLGAAYGEVVSLKNPQKMAELMEEDGFVESQKTVFTKQSDLAKAVGKFLLCRPTLLDKLVKIEQHP